MEIWTIIAAVGAVLAVVVGLGFGISAYRPEVTTHMGLGGLGTPLIWRPGERVQAFVYDYNEGGSPARRVRFRGWCRILHDSELDSPNAFREGRPNPEHAVLKTLHRGVEVAHYHEVLSDEVYPDDIARKAIDEHDGYKVYVFGSIEYGDGMNREYSTEFCVHYSQKNPTAYRWIEVPDHNDAN